MKEACDGIGISNEIPEENILNGMLMHPNFKEIISKKYIKTFNQEPEFYNVSISNGTNQINN